MVGVTREDAGFTTAPPKGILKDNHQSFSKMFYFTLLNGQ